jgi:maleylacetoacetate isomerase
MISYDRSGRYCHGNAVSLAVIGPVPQIYNARRSGVDAVQFPLTMQIAATLEAIEVFAAAHPNKVKPAP